ncbi:hypothetical protein PSAC2689_120171 [Paraburkholderia sacchari]
MRLWGTSFPLLAIATSDSQYQSHRKENSYHRNIAGDWVESMRPCRPTVNDLAPAVE